MVYHPCQDCPTRADHGVIACPIAGAVLNKGRCRRVQAMAPPAATANLAGVWVRRWNTAKESGDRKVLRFLRWQSTRQGRLVTVLAELTPQEQIKSLASPLIVRVRHSANGGDGAGADPHIDAIVSDVRRPWEQGDGAIARDGNAGRTRARGRTGDVNPTRPHSTDGSVG